MANVKCRNCSRRGCAGDCEVHDIDDYMRDIEIEEIKPKSGLSASHYVVPSQETPTLADVITSIDMDIVPRSNITIKLSGDHAIPDDGFHFKQSVSIIGDHDALSGAVFWRRPNTETQKSISHYRHTSSARGNGPFDIVLGNDNTIAVYGMDEYGVRNAHDDPDFSSITKKRDIIFYTTTGTLVAAKVVASSRGKNILAVFGDRIPFPTQNDKSIDHDHVIFNPAHGGYGFFFPPSVSLRGSTTNLKLSGVSNLSLQGIRVHAPIGLVITAGILSTNGCWYESEVELSGHVASSEFNINTAKMLLSGTSGRLNRQFSIGANSELITSVSKINLDFLHACSSKYGVSVKQGSSASMRNGLIVNCNTGLSCAIGSTTDITGTNFYSNRVGIKVMHGSTVTSDTPTEIVASTLPLQLLGSHFITKEFTTSGSKYYAAIDDEMLVSADDLKHDHTYSRGSSMVIDDAVGIHSLDFLSVPGSGKQHELDLAQLGISKVASKEVGRGLTHMQAIAKLQTSKKKDGKFVE